MITLACQRPCSGVAGTHQAAKGAEADLLEQPSASKEDLSTLELEANYFNNLGAMRIWVRSAPGSAVLRGSEYATLCNFSRLHGVSKEDLGTELRGSVPEYAPIPMISLRISVCPRPTFLT